jgi:hypothetical protein
MLYIIDMPTVMCMDNLDEIEDMCYWNLSFGVPIKETLASINRLDLLDFFLPDPFLEIPRETELLKSVYVN